MFSKRLLGVLFVLLSNFTLAQEITGDIRGIVRDQSGAAISGATVEVINTDRNATIRKLATDAAGAYVAPLLPLGRYKLTVTASGFQQYNATDIVLNVTERVNIQFRAEAFNVLNHTNWNNPASLSLTSGVYNKITTARDPRQMQLALKAIF